MSWISISKLKSRNAIRRGRVGVALKAEVYHCRSIDIACNEYFKRQGMPCHGFGNIAIGKKEGKP